MNGKGCEGQGGNFCLVGIGIEQEGAMGLDLATMPNKKILQTGNGPRSPMNQKSSPRMGSVHKKMEHARPMLKTKKMKMMKARPSGK